MDERDWSDSAGGARILIVDDDPADVRLLEMILRRAGYTNLRGTTDARIASGLFAEFEPDLMLLDLHMPFADGFEVYEQIKPAIPRGAYFPTMIITGDVSPAIRRKALVAGVEDFVLKPFQTTEVLVHIEHLLDKRYRYLAEIGQTRTPPDPDAGALIDPAVSCLVEADGHAPMVVADATGEDASVERLLDSLQGLLRTPEQTDAFRLLRAVMAREGDREIAGL